MTRDRRQHRRYQVEGIELALGAEVLDVSVSGVGVRTTRRLKVGDRLPLSLGRGAPPVVVSGTVQWCRRHRAQMRLDGSSEAVFEAGVAFDDTGDGVKDEIVRFISCNAVVEPEPELRGSYRIEDPDSMDVEAEHTCRIRRLGLGGALVDGQAPIPPESTIEVQMPLGNDSFYSCGRVVTVVDTLGERGRSVQIGVEFIATAPRQREVLERFIRRQVEGQAEERWG